MAVDRYILYEFLPTSERLLLTSNAFWSQVPSTLKVLSEQIIGSNAAASEKFQAVVMNTAGMLVVAPLIILYLFCQRYLIQGIEHSGFGGT